MTDEPTILEVEKFMATVQSAEVIGDRISITILVSAGYENSHNQSLFLSPLEAEKFLWKHPLGITVCVTRYAEVSNPPEKLSKESS